MGSEAPKIIFHVTGFKKFQGVAENPTEVLVKKLEDHMSQRGMPRGCVLRSCTILETAASGGLKALLELLDKAVQTESEEEQRRQSTGSASEGKAAVVPCASSHAAKQQGMPRVVWVHFGVNSGASKFAVERRAINEASFRCPDEQGWQPHKQPIVPEDGGMNRCRETKLESDFVVRALRVRGFDVALSDDAGRFVCNYVYYQSLRHAEANGAMSLFVHVPSFSVAPKDQQLWFAENLLDVLAECL